MILKILMKHVGDERLAQALVHLFFQLVGVLVSGSFEVPLQGLKENNLEFPDQCHIFLKIPTTTKDERILLIILCLRCGLSILT